MRLTSRRHGVLAAGVAFAMFLTACSGDADPEGAGAAASEEPEADEADEPDDTDDAGESDDPNESVDASDGPQALSSRPFRMAGPEPTQGFDPTIALADSSRIRMGLMYANLVEYDEEGEIVGALAESWDLSDDGLVWTFHLRDTARFSDGSQVTADDVIGSIQYVIDSEAGGGYPDIAEMRAVDDATVEIELVEPAGRMLLLSLIRVGTSGIISQSAIEEAGGPDEYFIRPTATSGPFTLEEFQQASHMTYGANEYFWREGHPKIQGIEMTFQDDTAAILAGLRTGIYDTAGVPFDLVSEMEASQEFDTYTTDTLAPTFWGIDHTQPPFDSQEVRQAFAYAVDRDGPRQACWFGVGAVSYGNALRPWNVPYYTEITTYDLPREDAYVRAAELLDEAGWVDNGSGTRVADGVDGVEDGTLLSVTVSYEANWPAAECNTLILQDTFTNVGVEIIPDAYDPAAFWGDVGAGEMKMWHGGAGSPDAESFFSDWYHSDGLLTPLTTRLDDPEIDELVTEGLTTPDLDRAEEIFTDLEAWQSEWLPLIIIGYQHGVSAVSAEVQNYWSARDSGSRPLTEVYFEE